MALPVNAIVSVIFQSEWVEQRILLTLNYKVISTDSVQSIPADVQSIADYFATAGATFPRNKYLLCLGTNVELQRVRAQQVSGVRSVYQTAVINAMGTGTADATTGNITGVITLRTAFSGRDQVGNKHIGPIPVDAYLDGSVTVGYKATLDVFALELLENQPVPVGGANLATLQPVIYHTETLTGDQVMSRITQERVGTLRRRTLRVGE